MVAKQCCWPIELRPDVILLDFLMPTLSGLQAAEEILKLMPLVPIVLYTMYDNAQLEAEAKKMGIRKIVSKANSQKLIAALEEVLGKPHDIGPIGVSSEYKVEPVSGEGSVSISTTKPPKPGTEG
jgi:DNA-binding NarL/FixJ family response regulator